MKIDSINNLTPLPGRERQAVTPPPTAQDDASFAQSAALARQLSQAPETRPEAVALAKQLLAQPDYPPDATIRGIANLLAINLPPEDK